MSVRSCLVKWIGCALLAAGGASHGGAVLAAVLVAMADISIGDVVGDAIAHTTSVDRLRLLCLYLLLALCSKLYLRGIDGCWLRTRSLSRLLVWTGTNLLQR